jgi:heme-degrading monooxygenase HmoA
MSTPIPVGAWAVIFISKRREVDQGYAETGERMLELVAEQPGYLGHHSVREQDGTGITVSYWRSEEDIRAWRDNAEHRLAQQRGRELWYDGFDTQVCRVERSYQFVRKP